ncbi:MAG TPA: aromatic ring-hydroxylating dioxygenase subunit alpha [Polyangiaceae bacterium]|nr:aromatic ring-hydroxylating dioxygenase subunit alpha [Polyangiaceae bacterium]
MADFVKTTDTYRQGALTLPGAYYTSAELFAEEQKTLFGRHWVLVGRGRDLKAPGEYVLGEVGGESLIVLRDRGGEARAFYNVCRHRGTRLCEAERGRFGETIQCPYHAWTYALDGALLGAPHMNAVAGFDRRDYPLHPAALAEWEGFLFASAAERPEPFERAFAPLAGRFERFRLPSLEAARRVEYDVAANWKLVFENYCECLHCPRAHPELARLSPYQSGENDLVEGPFLGGHMLLSPGVESLTRSGRPAGPPVGALPAEDMNRVYYYSIFPNMLLSLHPDYVMVHRLRPVSPARTLVTCEWLFHPEAGERPGFDPDDAASFWDEVNRQDWRLCELSQAGVSSRAYRPGPYSPRESVTAAWDREYLRAMGRAAP